MTRVRQAWRALFAVAALVMLLCIPSDSEAADGRSYRVHGQVIAVNVTETPHMIVVKTPLTKHNDMTVGAKVTAESRIIRKGKRIALQTIRVGEMVWLTYVKQRDGVFARTHSGFNSTLLVSASRPQWGSGHGGPRVVFRVGGLYDGFRHIAIKPSSLVPIMG